MWGDRDDDKRRVEGHVRGDKVPQTYTDGEWPYDAVPHADAPVPVYYSLALARTLDGLCTDRGLSHRALSLRAGIAANAVGRIVRGEVYPDLATLGRLEVALEASIFPDRASLGISENG